MNCVFILHALLQTSYVPEFEAFLTKYCESFFSWAFSSTN